MDMRYLELAGGETLQATTDGLGNVHTTLQYLDYYSEWGDWEEDAKLYSYNYADITSLATPDYITGHWTFTETHWPPVWIIGKTYDIWAASSRTLRKWASQLKLDFDFVEDQDEGKRSQKIQMVLQMALEYEGKARPRIFSMERNDVNPYR